MSRWNEVNVKEAALQYTRRSDFKKEKSGAYKYATSNGILDEVCSHMISANKTWDEISITKEAAKYKTRTQFYKGSVGAYEAAKRLNLLDTLLPERVTNPRKWNTSKIHKEALKYTTRAEFKRKNAAAYHAAVSHQVLPDVCTHMDVLLKDKWSVADLHKEALKYKSRAMFNKESKGAYAAAWRLGILDVICEHMPLLNKLNLPFDIDTQIMGVYILIDENTPVYIGKSNTCIRARILKHNLDKNFDTVEILPFKSEADMDVIELYLINKYKPLFNLDSNSSDALTIKIVDERLIFNNKSQYKRKTYEQ